MTWIATIITFLIGYTLGVHSQSPKKLERVAKKVQRKLQKDRRIGVIKKLTPNEMAKRGTRLEEEEKAMEKTLDDVL